MVWTREKDSYRIYEQRRAHPALPNSLIRGFDDPRYILLYSKYLLIL